MNEGGRNEKKRREQDVSKQVRQAGPAHVTCHDSIQEPESSILQSQKPCFPGRIAEQKASLSPEFLSSWDLLSGSNNVLYNAPFSLQSAI